MGGKQTRCILILLAVGTLAARAAEYKRDRYDVIVDRSPFGEDPTIANEAAKSVQDAAAAAAEAKKLEKEIRLCFLMETESGEIRAGFQNLKAQKGEASSVMLMVGENFKGMKLSKIDLPNSSATLESNGKPITFELAKAPAAAAPAASPAATPRRFGGGFRRPTEPVKPAEPRIPTPEEVQKNEEVKENLRQYQMEVIRAGMPPLPIPLTKDMDDQLVAEGILPPPGGE
ncbi:hypothetical protein PDESU_05107 [Pontiella desulfatans]|uniref:Uncharacterized protein n=1 Tax=Pontiella desulfatans TaxID=2750659 RepID=A0A6C2UB42_PONDE|nr:hypothetical protein [Pontiella desulfatans]VGO16516.1 hypothetical protein PDESU_05107 [Pontiella desulfatans]